MFQRFWSIVIISLFYTLPQGNAEPPGDRLWRNDIFYLVAAWKHTYIHTQREKGEGARGREKRKTHPLKHISSDLLIPSRSTCCISTPPLMMLSSEQSISQLNY